MADEDKQREMQQKYLELQIIDQQLKQLQKQIQTIDAQIIELNNTKANIDDLENIKPGSGVLIPVNPGIFFKGVIKNSKEFKVNVGANTVVNKSATETKELINQQINEMSDVREQLLGNMQELILQAQVVQRDLEKFSQ